MRLVPRRRLGRLTLGLSPGWSSFVGAVALACALLAACALADRLLASVRLDVTAERLYSLSPGTRQILGGITEPIRLRLYVSRRLGSAVPVMGAYQDRVVALLRRYVDASRGMLRLEILDPEPFSASEDQAIAAGLSAVPIERTGEQSYFGLVGTNLVDDERTISFLNPDRERFLEYDLTRLVEELSDPARPRIGVMSALPLDGDPQRLLANQPGGLPFVSMLQLRQAFDVRLVPTDARAIDQDLAALAVVHPQNLSDAAVYAIDQYVMRGGHLLLMIDPHNESQAAGIGSIGPDMASSIPRLLHAWGLGFDPSVVVGDLEGAWRVQGRPDERVQATDYPPWFSVRDGIARDDPATADLTQITLAAPGALTALSDAPARITPLLTSSPRSGVIPERSLQGDPDPVSVLADFHPDGARRMLAARLRGPLPSAFDTPPPDSPAGTPHLAHSDGPADVVVVADADILDDRFWVRLEDFLGQPEPRPFADNGAFLVNVVGSLAGGDALLGLRARGVSRRPLTAIEDRQHDAELRYRRDEQTLQGHLNDTLKRLASARTGGDSAVLTEEQRQAVDQLTADIAETRGRLRAVQLELRRKVDGIALRWRVICILLMPALVAAACLSAALWRTRRRFA